jgi:hypothetical protein
MTPRERVIAVLEGRIPDRIPWFTDLTYWRHGEQVMGRLPEKYEGDEGLLQLHKDLNVGIYLFTPSLIERIRDPELFKWYGDPADSQGVSKFYIETPDGNLEGLSKACPESFSSAILEYPVKSVDDLRVVRCWHEGTTWGENYAENVECDRIWGGDGLPVPLIPRTPLAAMAAEWSGVMNMSYIIADAPDAFEETLEVMRRCEDSMFKIYAESPMPYLEIGENLSAEAMGGLWRRYSKDYYRERCAYLHDHGKKIGCHIDGTLGLLLGDLVEVGIDFPESVVPAPVGDLTLDEIHGVMGDKAVCWGGIPSAMFAPPFDRETVLDFAKETIRTLGPVNGGRLVLAGADQVPPNGDIELVKIIAEMLEELDPLSA